MAFEDLRQGRLDIVPNYFTVDLPFYGAQLQDFLPDRIIDIHSHAWRRQIWQEGDPEPTYWPWQIIKGCGMPVPDLLRALLVLFPGKEVTPVILGVGNRDTILDAGTREEVHEPTEYLIGELRCYPHVYGLMRSFPDWTEEQLVKQYGRGRFSGLKPYLSMIREQIPPEAITVFDYLPRHHLKVAEERGWLIMLHIPGAERLADPANTDQMKEIADSFPDLKIIIAHIGRTYCPRYAEEGFSALGDTAKFFNWDFSANTLQVAMELLIEAVGPERILYGSDLPITAARARRVCEGDNYVNIMREADWEDSHTRVAPPDERDQITFLLYEEIAAFKRAAEKEGLGKEDIADVFYNNAQRLLAGTGRGANGHRK